MKGKVKPIVKKRIYIEMSDDNSTTDITPEYCDAADILFAACSLIEHVRSDHGIPMQNIHNCLEVAIGAYRSAGRIK